jgi:glycosyltransferase involved in cell wall biosynthesis
MSRIAFASTYPPRRCGIATFTAELGRAIGTREIVALRGRDDTTSFEREVHHVIRTNEPADHVRVATTLDQCDVDVVSVQHEFGIWGGDDGEFVLDFLAALSVPAVVTLHTVLRQPTPNQRRVMQGLLDLTAGVVVMSNAAASILKDEYSADPPTVHVIPHGVPDLPLVDPDVVKPAVGLEGRAVLLSFGLLGPSKGYESVIAAMPEIVRAQPSACYVILGATHPNLLRTEGERYRRTLESLTAQLGMRDHVKFVDRYVGRTELAAWLEAADVFVTPYPNLEQIVSGTLSYAMAAGKASVSTPYLYASEILADGRGALVAAGSQTQMTATLVELLTDRSLRDSIAARAYAHGREMIWSRVAAAHGRLLREVQATASQATIPAAAGRPLVPLRAAVPVQHA